MLITTLDFALRNFLDITSIIVGWGQSGEAGGKAHFAGVGFGGENALIHAFELAHRGHGYGVADFQYLVAHATGTRTNSKTDLTTAANARTSAAERQGRKGALPHDDRRHAEGGRRRTHDGRDRIEGSCRRRCSILLGKTAVGVPTLRNLDPELGPVAESFVLEARAGRRQHRRRCGVRDARFRRLQRRDRAARRARRSVRALLARSQGAVSVSGALAGAASRARAARDVLASAPAQRRSSWRRCIVGRGWSERSVGLKPDLQRLPQVGSAAAGRASARLLGQALA